MPHPRHRTAARTSFRHLGRALVVVVALLLGFGSASAYAANLTVSPLTWNVLGLDSNAPTTSGPDTFPVGARVCNNTGTTQAANTATFVWDSIPSPNYISLTSPSVLSIPTLAAGSCYDAYFTVVITRSTSALDFTRRFEIDFSLGSGAFTATTPTPRELYVEHLVSQNRNSVMKYSGPGGCDATLTTCDPVPSTWVVGQTYTVKLYSSSSTAYDQEEAFINFPGNAFQVISASATYQTVTAPASATTSSMYNDACTWDANPLSTTYKSCLGTGKAGGNIVTTYQVKAISANASATLHAMIQDFSGSSYHYNTDYNSSSSGLTVTAQFPLSVASTGSGAGTVSSSPAGINCGSTCTGTYAAATSVTLTAAPAPGSTFNGWGGACTGTGTTCQVTMSQSQSVTADFEAIPGTVTAVPDLTLAETHSGTFTQGDPADTHTATVSNTGTAATDGSPVTLTETAPPGETVTAIGGTGWSCTLSSLTCTRSDVLPAGQSYPALTITVAVDPNAPATLTNTVTVGGGGETDTTNDGAADVTQVALGSFPLAVTLAGSGGGSISDGGQISCLGACSGTYSNGSQVTLTAAAAAGSTFNGWNGACTGTVTTCQVTMNQAQNVTAEFVLAAGPSNGAPDLTVSLTHGGTLTQGDRADTYTATVSNSGTAPTNGTPVTFSENPPAGETATGLGGGGWTCVLATLTCARSDALPAGQSYPVIVITVNIDPNAPATLTNSVAVSGGGSPSGPGAQDSNVATISPSAQTLSVFLTGSGTVTSLDRAISCGSICSHAYANGSTVTLTATPASGWSFQSWSGGCSGSSVSCTVSMSAAQSVTAVFLPTPSVPPSAPPSTPSAPGSSPAGTPSTPVAAPNKNQLDVTTSGSGSVTAADGGIDCGTLCSGHYLSSQAVVLTARPASGWQLRGWSGACSGTALTCLVAMTESRTATATFQPIPPAAIAIAATLDRLRVRAGGAATLAISLHNASDHPVTLRVSVPLPANVTVSRVSQGQVVGGHLRWKVSLPAHSTRHRKAQLRIGGASRTLRFAVDAAGAGVRVRVKKRKASARLRVTRISHDAHPTG